MALVVMGVLVVNRLERFGEVIEMVDFAVVGTVSTLLLVIFCGAVDVVT